MVPDSIELKINYAQHRNHLLIMMESMLMLAPSFSIENTRKNKIFAEQ